MTEVLECPEMELLTNDTFAPEVTLITVIHETCDIGDLCITAKSINGYSSGRLNWVIMISEQVPGHLELAKVITSLDVNVHKLVITDPTQDHNLLLLKAICYSWPGSFLIPLQPGDELTGSPLELLEYGTLFISMPLEGTDQRIMSFSRDAVLRSRAIADLCLGSEGAFYAALNRTERVSPLPFTFVRGTTRESLTQVVNPYC